ncbi:hypothetical protein BDW74DRAFT_179256 [Aspergillus multicolor]|uniref:uncharacterized protein n=1 Tax=Aspergillus multicolor TaxID=41759 RepID=UPI003CCE3617
MRITELLLPRFKTDPESQSSFNSLAPSLFAHFRGVPGLTSFFRGRILVDQGQPIEENSGRGVLILEWDDLSSFHAFYPDSPTFRSFVTIAKEFVKEREYPELFKAVDSCVTAAEAGIMHILKVVEGKETEGVWNNLKRALQRGEMGAVAFSSAIGVEEQKGYFLGMVGWRSLEDYERLRTNAEVIKALEELGAGGVLLNIVVQVERMAI